jgi:Na+(H+)/acetate symporter ActP
MFAGALISAILSAVYSALLTAASLVSHDIVLRLSPGVSETRQDLLRARRRRGAGSHPGWGGAPSAYAAIVAGALVWACGKFALDMQAPYVSGVLAALLGYVLVTIATRSAAAERRTRA